MERHAKTVRGKRPWRLRTRLTLALVALFVAIAALVVVSHYQYLRDRRDSRIENVETVSRTLAAVVDGFTRDLESFALSTTITLGEGRTPFDQGLSAERRDSTRSYLSHLHQSYGTLRSIFVTNLAGRVVVSESDESTGLDLSGRSYVRALQGGAESFWSEGLAGAISGQTTVAYARVIRSPEGALLGFLVIAFYPWQLAERLPENLPSDGHVSLIDGNGTVLFSSLDPDGEAAPRGVALPASFAAPPGEPVTIRSAPTPVDADERYGAFVGLERTGWVVGLTLPAAAIDGPLQSIFQRDLVVISVLLFVGLATMLIIASRLSRPLSTLADAAAAISRGERAARPIVAADADVSQLASAIEEMSRAIAEREQRLSTQASVLEAIERTGELLASELELEKVVRAVTEAGVGMVGAEAAVFLHRDETDGSFTRAGAAGAPSSFLLSVADPVIERTLKGETVLVADLSIQPGRAKPPPEAEERLPCGFLGVPVRSREGEVVGALFLLHSRPRAFNHYHQRLAVGLARWASIVLDNAKLYKQAQEVLEQLRKASFAKDEFLAVLAHELRTPITTIYGGARFLRARRDKLSDEARDEMIASIAEESERLHRLVEDLLAIARTEMTEGVAGEPVSVPAAVEQVAKQFKQRYPGRPLEVRVERGLAPVLAEPTYLQQIVTNLVSNADKYSDPGLPIEIEASAADGEVTINVLDRGPAVPADELASIFDSFYRSERTSGRAAGKGLGLTVCKRLVEAMSGRIWAELRPDGGLQVAFALPVALESAAPLATSDVS